MSNNSSSRAICFGSVLCVALVAGSAHPQDQLDATIDSGLAYLAKNQLEGGNWTLQSDSQAIFVSDTAATGLALLAFQAAGHRRPAVGQEKRILERGSRWLAANQKADGDLFKPTDDKWSQAAWLYSHAIATWALCEACTKDAELTPFAQKAVDFIVAAQDKQIGGWRYQPGTESDTSVTAWMSHALFSANEARLTVPASTFAGIEVWLNKAQQSEDQAHLYRYNPYAGDSLTTRHGLVPTESMTAAGLSIRLHSGWKADRKEVKAGVAYLLEHPPQQGTRREPKRDAYYWFFATAVVSRSGGDACREWVEPLRALLVESQIQDGEFAGSWDPRRPVYDRWGSSAGRIYLTALNVMTLAIQCRDEDQ